MNLQLYACRDTHRQVLSFEIHSQNAFSLIYFPSSSFSLYLSLSALVSRIVSLGEIKNRGIRDREAEGGQQSCLPECRSKE